MAEKGDTGTSDAAKRDPSSTAELTTGQGRKSETALREEQVLEFWKENKTFERSLEKPAPKGEFVFYDGPPFATGLPHHGSLLSSIIKDVIPRYKTMRGYRVRRRWGWDTHGLPIETLVEKELGLKTKKDIETLGVDKFNAKAREMVMKFVDEWEKYIERIGRWVDFKNSYKTMDNTYIGSVWWALKELHTKGLLYEGRKVLMYCPHCETPLAKAEIAMDNTYQDVTEEAVTVKFKVKMEGQTLGLNLLPNTFLLAWTTTPWTLPGNVALAINPALEYGAYERDGEAFIVAVDRAKVYGFDKPRVTWPGSQLRQVEYENLYNVVQVAQHKGKHWEVLGADFVSAEDGTGIVHIAPMYGEDDFALGQKEGLPMVQLLNPNGTYNDEAPEFLRGIYLREANKDVKRDLQERGLLFARENHTHSYPHCYRCGTPLIYNAVPSWFINIQKVKARLIEENEKINWVPEHLKNGRFGKIVESAPDWTISRNRFWASPLPIWKEKGGSKVMVIGSLGELKERVKKSGNTYYLLRHGEAEQNAKGIVSCERDDRSHLTAKGEEQVRESVARLAHNSITRIYSSPLPRALESAEIAAEVLGIPKNSIHVDERLGEFHFGKLNKGTYEDFLAYRKEHMKEYADKMPDGESYLDAKRRFGEFLLEIEREQHNENILIATHGVAFEALLAVVAGTNKEESRKIVDTYKPEYAQIQKLDFMPLPLNADYELDLHRPYTDSIVLVDGEGREYERIKEVVDCWVESGAMPFAEYHYPFENKEEFEKRSPGDFIAEYIAQTRTWFYYMHAMGVLLFDRLAFKNVVVTGTIGAADGQKISKSKGNYTDPLVLIDQYGADAMRLYLMGSPVMQAEDLRFRDEDVRDAHNRVIGILWNSYKFFDLYQKEYDGSTDARKSAHVLDRWILALLDETVKEVTDAMESYDTPRTVRAIKALVDPYSTWYVRRSRERVKSEWHEKQFALATQREVLLTLSKLIAPIMPFLAESIYRGIEDGGSVHLQPWPETARTGFFSRLFGTKKRTILEEMAQVRAFVTKTLEARDKAGIKVRQPLTKLEIGSTTLSKELRDVIREEVNVKEVALSTELPAGDVRLDTNMTPELKEEGFVRDLVRAIQSARKEAGLSPHDTAKLTIDAVKETTDLIEKQKTEIIAATHTEIAFGTVDTAKQHVGEHDISLSVSKLVPRT